MKEVKQGTIYGYDLVIKVPNEDTFITVNTLSNHLKNYYHPTLDYLINLDVNN